MLAVGKDAHADAALPLGLLQVVVELPDVLGVGLEAGGGADPALDLYEGIEGGEVDGAVGAQRGRVLLVDLVAVDEAGADQEVAHGGGDVGLELAGVVPTEYLRGGLGAGGVVGVDVYGQGVVLQAALRLAQMGVGGTREAAGDTPDVGWLGLVGARRRPCAGGAP